MSKIATEIESAREESSLTIVWMKQPLPTLLCLEKEDSPQENVLLHEPRAPPMFIITFIRNGCELQFYGWKKDASKGIVKRFNCSIKRYKDGEEEKRKEKNDGVKKNERNNNKKRKKNTKKIKR